MVRARLKGDLTRFFGKQFRVTEMAAADYRYRTVVSRSMLKFAAERAISGIDYANFKSSIPKDMPERHTTYMSVWAVMSRAQQDELRAKLPKGVKQLWGFVESLGTQKTKPLPVGASLYDDDAWNAHSLPSYAVGDERGSFYPGRFDAALGLGTLHEVEDEPLDDLPAPAVFRKRGKK
jgi:hypothetical protein